MQPRPLARLLLPLLFVLAPLLHSAPVITTQPANVQAVLGQPAALSVTATGSGPLSYQWRKYGHPVPGATQGTLQLNALDQAGFYDVVVTDGPASVTSQVVRVAVAPASYASGPLRARPTFLPRIEVAGANILAFAVDVSNNKIYIAGEFTRINGTTRLNLARFDLTTGALDADYNPAALAGGGFVRALLVQSDGRVIIGGDFTAVGGVARNRIARLNVNGTLDTSFNPGTGFNGSVHALARQGNKLLVGGSFNFFNGSSTNATRLARLLLDGTNDGAIDPSFVLAGAGFPSDVRALAVQSDNRIVVGGQFTNAVGVNTAGVNVFSRLARLMPDGAADTSFVIGSGANSTVHALALQTVDGEQRIVVGGAFTTFNGPTVNRLIRLRPNGAVDTTLNTTMGSSVGFNADVLALAIDSDNKIVAGGGFTTYQGSGTNATRIVRIDHTGVQDAPAVFSTGSSFNSNVNALALHGAHILVGGWFTTYNNAPREGLARLGSDGSLESSLAPASIRRPGSVLAIEPVAGGKWLVGGNFHFIDDAPRNHLARFNADGTLDSWTPAGTAFNAPVNALAVYADGQILAGGWFSAFNSVNRSRIARLNTDGTLDGSFVPGVSLNSQVTTLALQADGKIVAGGAFTDAGHVRIVRLNGDGSADTAFNANTAAGFSGDVRALAVQLDGRIVVGGNFATFAGNTVNNIARLKGDGTFDNTFNSGGSGFSIGQTVWALSTTFAPVQADQKLIAAGFFSTYNDATANRIVRLTQSGAVDPMPALGSGPTSTVTALALQADGRMVIAGFFGFVNGTARPLFARLDANGALDGAFALPSLLSSISNNINVLRFTPEGNILYGATRVDYAETIGGGTLGLLEPAPLPTITTPPANVASDGSAPVSFTVVATAGGSSSGLQYQWHFNGDAIAGATNATYTISNPSVFNTGQYTVRVSNLYGSILSAPATLSGSTPPPTITAEPPAFTALTAGQNGSLTLTASGSGLTYYWTKYGAVIPGATTATLNLPSAGLDAAGLYVGHAVNGLSSTSSRVARVEVTPGAFPNSMRVADGFNAKIETSGSIAQFALLADGRFYVIGGGGGFTSIGGAPRLNIARFLATGEFDTTFTATPIVGGIHAVAVQSDGKLVLGGSFISVGGVNQPTLVRLNLDGTRDPSFTPTARFSGTVDALLIESDQKIVIAGNFNEMGGLATGRIARLNPDGTLDPAFVPGTGFDGPVTRIVRQSDGKYVVGGSFTSFSGAVSGRIARLNSNGTLDPSFNTGLGFDDAVGALALDADGKVLVGGNFLRFGATPAPRIVRLTTTGALDNTFVAGSGFNGAPTRIAVQSDGKIVVTGAFATYAGVTVNRIARLETTGALDTAFATATGTGFNNVTAALDLQPDGKILVGGVGVTTFNGTSRFNLVRLTATGADDGTVTAAVRSPGTVMAVVPVSGAKFVIGGSFTHVDDVPAGNIARVNANGTLDSTFNSGTGFNGAVRALVVQGDGHIVAGGSFTSYNGSFSSTSRIARLSADGVLDMTFAAALNNTVFALAQQANGQIVIGGSFTTFGGAQANRIARIWAPGGTDTAFLSGIGGGFNGQVNSLLTQPDGKVIAGGLFTTFDTTHSTNGIARLDANGTIDSGFTIGAGFGINFGTFSVNALALAPDGKIVVGGAFNRYNNAVANQIARLRPNGTLDGSFATGSGPNGSAVTAVLAQSDGKVIVAGNFNQVNGERRGVLARFQPNGALDASFGAGFLVAAPTSTINALVPLGNGTLLMASGRQDFPYRVTSGLAVFEPAAPLAILYQPFGGVFQAGSAEALSVTAIGPGPLTYQWKKDGANVVETLGDVVDSNRPELRFLNAQAHNAGVYTVTVSDGTNSVTSTPLAVIVKESAPMIEEQTAFVFGQVAQAGTVGFQGINAVGSAPIAAQWQKDGVNVPGGFRYSQLHRLPLVGVKPADAGVYRVTLTNAHGSATSNATRLFVNEEPGWALHAPWPAVNGVTTLGVSNGQIFVGGLRGVRLNSADGATWSQLPPLSQNNIVGFAQGGGREVILGSLGFVAVSVNNGPWQLGNMGTMNSVVDVVHGNGVFVATAVSIESATPTMKILSSTDGLNWTVRYTNGTYESGNVAFGNNTFAVRTNFGGIVRSTDGINWVAAPATLPLDANGMFNFANGLFFLGGPRGELFTSPDTIMWTPRATGTNAYLGNVAFGGGTYVVVGGSGTILTSPDAATWTLRSSGVTNDFREVAYANGTFVTISNQSVPVAILSSPDGITWTNRVTSVASNFALNGLATDFTSMVAVGVGGMIVRTTDGTNWAAVPSGLMNTLSDVAFIDGAYYAVGSGGNIRRSTDGGNTWNAVASGTGTFLRFIDRLNGVYLATGALGVIIKSTDGTAWSEVPSGTSGTLWGAAYGAGLYVAVGDNGTILTSPDATTWTPRPANMPVLAPLNEVVFANNLFVAVGGGGAILTSPDGLTWTPRNLNTVETYQSVNFFGSRFFISGGLGTVYSSTDGITWDGRYTGRNAGFNDLRAFSGRLYGVAQIGTIMSAPFAPVILEQPKPQAVVAGRTATLRVLAAGSPVPVSYQWQKNNVDIAGATNATFAIPAMSASDADTYRVVISTPGHAPLNSANAALTLLQLPAITAQPTIVAQAITGTTTLAVTATGTSPLAYQWYRGLPGDTANPIAGATSPNFTTPALTTSERYWVRVSNAGGSIDSEPITVLALAPRNSPLVATELNGLAFGNNTYVAVAGGNTIITSKDNGITWTRTLGLTGTWLRAVAYGTRFVAVGDNGAIRTSDDGLNWTTGTSDNGNNSLYGICWDGSRYVAVGANSTVLTSTDGLTWTPGALGTSGVTLRTVAFGSGTFVAAAGNGALFTWNGTDASWTARSSPTTAQLNGIAFGRIGSADTFVVVGNGGVVVASTDGGATWTQCPSNTTNNLRSVAFGNDRFIAASGGFHTSTNGTDWSPASSFMSANGATMSAATFANNQFVFGGFAGAIFTSPTGAFGTWTLRNSAGTFGHFDSAYAQGRFVTVGSNGTIIVYPESGTPLAKSPAIANVTSPLRRIIYADDLYVAVGDNGRILTSFDTDTWTNVTLGSVNFTALAHGAGRYVAAGAGGMYATSSDGLTWTMAPGLIGSANVNALAFAMNQFVAVTSSGGIFTSADGLAWTAQSSGVTDALNAVFHGGPGFIVVGNNSTVLTSPNGTTWTKQTVPVAGLSLNDVAYGDGMYVAVHNGPSGTNNSVILTSRDTITWSSSNPASSLINQFGVTSVVYGNGSFFIPGPSGLAAQSIPAPDTMRILTQPVGQTFASGSSVNLNVTAIGAVAYQWFEGSSGDLSRPVSGATAAAFNTGPLTESKRYWVGVFGHNEAVDSVTVDLLGPPTILRAPPTALAVNDGSTTTLAVRAIGSGSLTYQWKHNATDIPGATNAVYTFNASPGSAGTYTVVVSNGTHSATSTASTLTVVPVGPTLVQQATLGLGAIVQANSGVDLQFHVTGTAPVSVKWQKNGVDIPGSTQAPDASGIAHLHFLNIKPSDTGVYTAVATNSVDTVTSVPNNQAQFVVEESNWTWHNQRPITTSPGLFDVTARNGQFLLTGGRGFRASSADGINWTQQPSFFSTVARSYVSGNGVLLLNGGNGTVARSMDDGITWTAGNIGRLEAMNEIVFGNGVFVAVCSSGLAYTSPDGLTWTPRTTGITEPLFELTFGAGKFVASTASGQLITSADGATWSAAVDSGFTRIWLLRFVNNRFFLGDNAGGLKVSADAQTWTPVNSGVTNLLFNVAYANNRYVLVGSSGLILTSDNGTDWTPRASGLGANAHLGGVAFLNGTWVVCSNLQLSGANAQNVLTSTDNGETWVNRSSGTGVTFASVATDGATSMVAVGGVVNGEARIVRSTDGASWAIQTSGVSVGLNDVTYFDGSYVAAGAFGTMLTSSSGMTWATAPSGTTSNLQFVGALNGKLHASGASGTILARDSVGAWSVVASGTTTQLNGMAYGSVTTGGSATDVYVAVGNSGAILRSTTAAAGSWSATTVGTAHLNRVAFGNGAFVAVGTNGTILRSTDGTAWTPTGPTPTLPEHFLGVSYIPATGGLTTGYFMVSGSGSGVFVSTDGLTWTPRYAGIGNAAAFRAVTSYQGRVYAVGGLGIIASAALQPVIAQQPQSLFAVGNTAGFHVLAAGAALPTSYQWRKNGADIAGATTPRLTLANLQPSDLGAYDVVITTAAGSVTSAPGVLTSPVPVILDAPTARRAVEGADVEFRVSAFGLPPFTYQWRKDGTDIAGATDASLRLTGITAAHAGGYSVRVANAHGDDTSPAAALTVLTPDNVLWQQFTEWSTEHAPGRTVHDGAGKVYLPWSVLDRNPDVVGGSAIGALARLMEADGTLDPTFRIDPRYRRASHAAVQPDGKVLVGVSVGDASTVIRVDNSGVLDSTFNAPLFARSIRFITLQADGKVLVVAADGLDPNAPPSALGASAPALYRLTASGDLDPAFTTAQFSTMGGNLFGPPVVDSAGRIYLTGIIPSVNGVPRSGIARLDASGALDTAYANPATLPAGFFGQQGRGVALQSDGRAIFVGHFRFTARGTITDPVVALRMNDDGTLDMAFGMPLRSTLGLNPGTYLRYLVLQPNDAIIGVSDRLVQLTANGTVDPSFATRPFARETFWISKGSDGRLYVPDQLSVAGKATQLQLWGNGVARFTANGMPDETFQTGGWGRTAVPTDAGVLGDGRIWVAGAFNRYGAAVRPGLAQFTAAGALTNAQVASDRSVPFGAVTSAGGDNVFAILGQAGTSTQPGAVPVLRRVLPTGAVDTTFVPQLPANYGLNSSVLTAAPGGSLVLAQATVTAQAALNGATGDALIRLNATGSRDTSFTPELSSFAVVERNPTTRAVTMIRTGGLNVTQILPDGSTLVVVSLIDGTPKLLRLTPAGTVDTTFTPPSFGTITPASGFTNTTTHDPVTNTTGQFPITTYTASDLVRAAVQMPDGKVYVGGRFALSGAPGGLVRLNSDGTLDPTFTGAGVAFSKLDSGAFVTALALDATGRVYVAGRFDTFNGAAVPGIFRLAPDGTLDTSWSAGFAVLDTARSVVRLIVAGTKLYAVGAVGAAGDTRPSVFRVADIPPPATIHSVTPASASAGATVTINGVGFAGATAVRFGTLDATSFSVVSDTQITAVVPTFAVTGSVFVTTAGGSTLTSPSALAIPQAPHLRNTAIRANVGGGENALLANFTIEGAAPKTMLVRGIGPGLVPFGVNGAISDPQLAIHDATGAIVASNNDWGGSTAIANAATAVGAFALSSTSKDAAVLVNLAPGTYTARVTGVSGVTGEGLLEVYETGDAGRTPHLATRARGTTGTSTGFVIGGGTGTKTVLIRAVGAGLGTTGALANPVLTLFSGTTSLASNDNWGTHANQPELAAATAAVGAMPLAANDSALLINLAPGAYRADVTGGTGLVMTEVFVVDGYRAPSFAPALLAPLQSQTLTAGGNVTFAAPFVAKPGSVAFQWRKNGADLAGATTATFTLSNATVNDAGSYSVVMQTTAGATTSVAATLGVNAAPVITTQPVARTIVAGQSATFTVAASGFPEPAFQWRRNGLNLAGATSATLTLSNVPFNGGGRIDVVASNPIGSDTSVSVMLTVNPVAPLITSPANAAGVLGRAFSYQVTTASTQATYTATGLPTGLTLDTASGSITGVPTATGVFNATITATNVTSSNSKSVTITILPPPPIINSAAAATGRVGAAFTFAVLAVNMGDGSSFAATGLPAGLTINPATGVISGTPGASGTFNVILSATNATGTVTSPFQLTIDPPLNVPAYTGPSQLSAVQGAAFTFTPTFSHSPTAYAATGLPAGFGINAGTGVISGTSTVTGTFAVSLSATNAGGTTTVALTITLNPAPTAPVISSSSTASATVGSGFTFTLTASQSPTSFAATGLGVFNLNATTGVISGTPTAPGTITVRVRATNGVGTGPESVLVISVSPAANAPIITSAPVVQGRVGDAFTYTLTASNSPTSFALTSGTLPAGLTFDATTGAITGTPTQVGQRRVWFAASNATGQGLGLEVLFSIAPADTTPVITSNGTAAGQAGQPFSYVISATNSPTSFAIASGTLPAGLSLDVAAGVISGIPAEATSKPVVVMLTAANGSSSSSPKSLTITIAAAPATPVITSALTASARAGSAFSYQVTASENATSFVAAGLPAGLTLNASSGAVSGSPSGSGTFQVALRAANAAGLGAPSTLVISVAPAAAAPSITSAASASGKVGAATAFSYQITTSVPTGSGPVVSYDLVGTLPLGLSFNTSTGVLSGRPAEAGVFTVQLTATNDGGTSLPQSLVLNIAPADNVPVITSGLYASATVGQVFSYQITAASTPAFPAPPFPAPFLLDAVNLPEGLAVNPSTGLIQGVPTTAGVFVATLVGTNGAGTGPYRELTIFIDPAPTAPVVTSLPSAAAQVGTAFSYQITGTNLPTAFEVLGAPSWMSVNGQTGAVAGVPTTPGSLSVRLIASNAAGISNPVTLLITVAPAANTPIITSSRTATGQVQSAFTYTITGTNSPTSFIATGLPQGLSLNATTGVISGTPTVSGQFEIALLGVNGNGTGQPVTLILSIQPNVTFVVPGN